MATVPYLQPLPREFHVGLLLARLGNEPGSFCLDTGQRYTILGANPVATISSQEGFITCQRAGRDPRVQIDSPVAALQRFAEHLTALPADPYLPFYGGLVGFVGFEWGAQVNQIPYQKHNASLPDSWFGLYDTVVVVDHLEGTSYIASLGLDDNLQSSVWIAQQRVDALLAQISEPAVNAFAYQPQELLPDDLTPVSPLRRYRAVARELQQCLWQGVAQKINLAQRYVGLMQEEPWAIHARLREMNPTPYGSYLNIGSHQLCSASPTCFLSLDGRELFARPVLAHRLRHHDPALPDVDAFAADRTETTGTLHRLREELAGLSDGPVREGEHRVESDSQAAHLACDLRLTLRSPLSILDALAALVPGLSMTGFPKVDAMQLLSHHEPFPRQAYTGAVGFWAPNARAQFNLCVRLLTIHEGLGYVHAASWLDARTDVDDVLETTNQRAAAFFSRLHNMSITTINEQSLY